MAEDWAACRRVIARHSKSFDLAARLLPAARRDEVAALYAWCRGCDDAIDLAPPDEHAAALSKLRAQLASVYAGAPLGDDPVLACFRAVVERRAIPEAYPQALLDGMAMDAAEARYERVDDLLVYCWRAAGTVGLMMCHVLGVADERAAMHAAHLGIAMQLTNVCRDVAEDWERGRVYVPRELVDGEVGGWLDAHRAASRPPLPASASAAFARAIRALLTLADRYYASADEGIAHLEPRSALAVRTARLVYAEIGRRVEHAGCDPRRGRAVVPTGRKLALAARAVRRFATERRAWPGVALAAPRAILGAGDAIRLA